MVARSGAGRIACYLVSARTRGVCYFTFAPLVFSVPIPREEAAAELVVELRALSPHGSRLARSTKRLNVSSLVSQSPPLVNHHHLLIRYLRWSPNHCFPRYRPCLPTTPSPHSHQYQLSERRSDPGPAKWSTTSPLASVTGSETGCNPS